jgi:lipopolysaccharide/colanic/teichoic acid biosynthesis glycosyltransferase
MAFYTRASSAKPKRLNTMEVQRRVLDVVTASVAILLLFPLMLVISFLIWLESGRPILFSQNRLGLRGSSFRMFKFRKFRKECGATGLPLTLQKDTRLTTVGKFLRVTKLDELPQFWNVLRGDMSIVGPRPESPAFADSFTYGFEKVLDYKPGIIGPSQLVFRNESSLFPPNEDPREFYRAVLFPQKAQIDLEYYQHRTLHSDIALMANAVVVVLGWPQASPLASLRSTKEVGTAAPSRWSGEA